MTTVSNTAREPDGAAALERMKCSERQDLAAELWRAVIAAPEGSRERAEAKEVWRWAHSVWSGLTG